MLKNVFPLLLLDNQNYKWGMHLAPTNQRQMRVHMGHTLISKIRAKFLRPGKFQPHLPKIRNQLQFRPSLLHPIFLISHLARYPLSHNDHQPRMGKKTSSKVSSLNIPFKSSTICSLRQMNIFPAKELQTDFPSGNQSLCLSTHIHPSTIVCYGNILCPLRVSYVEKTTSFSSTTKFHHIPLDVVENVTPCCSFCTLILFQNVKQ